MSLTQVSSLFFFELALGLHVALACTDRRTIGPGFTRLMTLFSLGSLLPAWLLGRGGDASAPALAGWLAAGFAALVALTLLLAGRIGPAVERVLFGAAVAAGTASMLLDVHAGLRAAAADHAPLMLASSAASMLMLGLVTGAMILGHWYLVTPDLPVAHLGRTTRLALIATYAKLALLAATTWLFADRLGASARAFGAIFGFGSSSAEVSFQSQLDFLWFVARVVIGLIGPAALCHMTMATVRLKATQPATGILYAATVTVLMGELFALVGAQSFGVVL